jgi:stage V sporulation protein S
VSSGTGVKDLAHSILTSLQESQDVEVRAIGAGANNQAIKALATARSLIPAGKDLLVRPGFDNIMDDGKEKTVIVLRIVVQ